MTFAFIGLFSSAVFLPVTVASTGIAYTLPYPESSTQPEETWRTMSPFSIAITALYHLTLIASLCVLLLMSIERCREIRKIHPDRYIESGRDERGEPYRRSMLNADRYLVKNPPTNRKNDPDVIPREEELKFGRVQDTFLYAFQKSYTSMDLVMALVVPLASGIITTVSVALFESRFEPYGIITGVLQGRSNSINGLLSYGSNSFPSNVYMYAFTIGLMIVACHFLNLISFFKCKTLISIAKYLPGYRNSRDFYRYGKSNEDEFEKPTRLPPRVELNAVKVVKVVRNPKMIRQDPEGLSVDEPGCLESSMSSIPPPPASLSTMPATSLDNLSLPPPPPPESMSDSSGRLLVSFPSLPAMNKVEEDLVQDPYDDEITGVKAEAFFGNIRQTKVVIAVFLLFFLLSAPSMVLFTMGAFYSHNQVVTRFMGFTNTTTAQIATTDNPRVTESSNVIRPTVTVVTNAGEYQEMTTSSMISETNSAVTNNWLTTLSGLFMVFYALASVAPFFIYCGSSRKFRFEASRFLCSCVPFRCRDCRNNRSDDRKDIPRYSRANQHIVNPRVKHSNSFRFTGNLARAPVKLLQVQKRRDKPGGGERMRNERWDMPDHYGTARL